MKSKSVLGYDKTLKLLLTKGVCGHSHIEGGHITDGIVDILHKVEELYSEKKELADRFKKLTGREYKEILQWVEIFRDKALERDRMDFVNDFLTSLFVMKLAEASSPEIIRRLTYVQLLHELDVHAGVTIEVYPLVWMEMGLDFDKCTSVFVRGVEDVLKEHILRGPLKIGVGTKRYHLVEQIDKEESNLLGGLQKPYLKSIDLIRKLKQSKYSDEFEIFGDVIDLASKYPLFSCESCPDRSVHTRNYFEALQKEGVRIFVHLLEQLPGREILTDDCDLYHELDFVMNLFKDIEAKNVRLIHMAYWPQNLPYLEFMKKNDFEIAICQTSTRKLGAVHEPRSPFLLKNPDIINGHIFDDDFIPLVISNDDSGPLGVEGAWEELELVTERLKDWYCDERAYFALIQFLRNDYEGWRPKKIAEKYGLDEGALEWVMAYDLFEEKSKLKEDISLREKVVQRGKDIMRKREEMLAEK
jgi:hypothetical protein